MKLYYLTTAQIAVSNLALKRIKISRFSDLNDPFELLPAAIGDPYIRRTLRAFKEKINESKGLICLSETCDNPVMWGHYGHKHTGVAIAFEVPKNIVLKVIYSDSLIEIPIDAKTKLPVPDTKTVDRLLRTKFRDWSYEREWRMFFELDHTTAEGGLHFQDFSDDLRPVEVLLGPRCPLPVARMEELVRQIALPVRVVKMRMAFKSFRVVENRAVGRGLAGA